MYKQDGMSAQDEETGVKKGFAPFKPQRRRKKEKGADAKARPEDQDVKAKVPKQVKQEIVASVSPKPVEVVKTGGREKGPPANAPVPAMRASNVQQQEKVSKSSVVANNPQKYPKPNAQASKVDTSRSRDDRHKVRRSERERDREERRRKRERRERREQRQAEQVQGGSGSGANGGNGGSSSSSSSSVAPAGSQVLPPISKSTHGQPKSIQSLKIDMAPGVKHRSSTHRHHHQSNHPKSHRMPGHKNSSYGGYGSGANNSSSYGPGGNYNKKKYYSSVADGGSTKRSNNMIQPHRSSRHANPNRGYVGHHHGSKASSSNHYTSNSSYHNKPPGGKVNRGKANPGLFGLPSNNNRHGGGAKQPTKHGSNSGQYGRFGYQARKGGAPKGAQGGAQGGGAPGRYESPYSQKALKTDQQGVPIQRRR